MDNYHHRKIGPAYIMFGQGYPERIGFWHEGHHVSQFGPNVLADFYVYHDHIMHYKDRNWFYEIDPDTVAFYRDMFIHYRDELLERFNCGL